MIETYLTHVRVIEDSQYPHSRPPPSQPDAVRKHRILIISVRHSGRIRVHKARQNTNLTFQIGKSWNMEDLTKIENDGPTSTGFFMTLGKNYFWATHTTREKAVFINSTIRIYKKYTGGKTPELIGFDNIGTPPPSPRSTTEPSPKNRVGDVPTHSPLAQVQVPHARERGPSLVAGSRPDMPLGQRRRPSVTNTVPQIQQSQSIPPQQQIPPNALPRPQQPLLPARPQQPLQSQPQPQPLQQRKGSLSHGSGPGPIPGPNPGIYNGGLNKSQDAFNIPPKSSARPPGQIRRAESQPRMIVQPGPGTARGPVPLPNQAPGQSSASTSASSSFTQTSGFSTSSLGGAPNGQTPPGSISTFSQGTSSGSQNSGLAPALSFRQPPIERQRPPAEPEVPIILLNNDTQPISPLKNESPQAPRSINNSIPRVITSDFDRSKNGNTDLNIDTTGTSFDNSNKRSSVQNVTFSRVHSHPDPDPRPHTDPDPIPTSNMEEEDDDDKPYPPLTTTRFEIEDKVEELAPTPSRGPDVRGIKFQLKDSKYPKANNRPQLVPVNESGDNNSEEIPSDDQDRKTELIRSRISFMAANNASVVEETLGELNWSGRSDVQTLELNISNEITSLENDKLHNVVDLDGGLDQLDQSLENAIKDCERLDAMFAFFSVQLGSFADQISLIEGQGQGLQVQTRNQKVLWTELSNILHTVTLPTDVLNILTTHDLRSLKDISIIENVLKDLYQAVKAVRSSGDNDTGDSLGAMKALKEKRHVYEQSATNFMLKVKTAVDQRVVESVKEAENQITPMNGTNPEPTIVTIEDSIYRTLIPLSAVILFVKEIDELSYFSILRSYENHVKIYYDDAANGFVAKWKRYIGKIPNKYSNLFTSKQPAPESSGYTAGVTNTVKSSLKRSQTLAKMRSYSDKGIDRNNSISVAPSDRNIGTDVTDISLILKPTNIRPSIVKAIKVIRSLIIKEQDVLIEVFHQSSFGGSRYPEFLKSYPLSQRRIAASNFNEKIYEIDSDRTKAQDLLNLMTGIFNPLQDHLLKFTAEILEQSSIDCPGVITALDIMLKELQTTNLDFLTLLYQRLHDRLLTIWNQFIDKQVDQIGRTMINSKKRSGPIYIIRAFPLFCQRIEQDVAQESNGFGGVDRLPVRKLINESYTKMGKAILSTLQKAENDATNEPLYNVNSSAGSRSEDLTDYEDKELMNYHVLMIENMDLFCEGLDPSSKINLALKRLRESALAFYNKEVKLYISFILHRPIGKLMDFLDNIEQILRKNPDDNPALKPGLNRSALKKLLINFDVKELRKVVDGLYKRVEKHFTEELINSSNAAAISSNRKLINKVWLETEHQFLAFVRQFRPYIEKYYSMAGDSGYVCKIDFTDADISEAFKSRGNGS